VGRVSARAAPCWAWIAPSDVHALPTSQADVQPKSERDAARGVEHHDLFGDVVSAPRPLLCVARFGAYTCQVWGIVAHAWARPWPCVVRTATHLWCKAHEASVQQATRCLACATHVCVYGATTAALCACIQNAQGAPVKPESAAAVAAERVSPKAARQLQVGSLSTRCTGNLRSAASGKIQTSGLVP
jgi:hypothetical protein